jgi:hypothetical protein
VAFVVGAAQTRPRDAAAAGFVTLALAIVSYYAVVQVRFGYGASTTSLLIWGIAALCGGPALGAAGWYWRFGSFRARTVAVALMGSVWVAEAAYLFIVLSMPTVAAAYAVIGLGLPLLLARDMRSRILAWAAMIPTVALGGLGFVIFIRLQELLAGIR